MISDEQVRIALKVWFQDEECEPGVSAMRDMRAALEASCDGPPPPPGTDAEGWHVCQWRRVHPVHGTFFVGRLVTLSAFSASRVHVDVTEESGLGCERLGFELATLEDAKAAVARRIAELDAAQAPEQLEACR